jgi:hypothetical protein
LADIPDVPRRRRPGQGVRRLQLGESLAQSELAPADPAAAEE